MHGTHMHHRRGRVARRMRMKRRMGMMAAMGRGPWADHDHGEGWGPKADEKLRWLEEYQRDLEQETADVASHIATLKTEVGQTPDA